MGGVMIKFSMDRTQIHKIGGCPFLTSRQIISCFKMFALESYARSSNDDIFKSIQKIAQFNYQRLVDEHELVDDYLTLCSENLTFVDN